MFSKKISQKSLGKKTSQKSFSKKRKLFRNNIDLYLLLLPGIIYLILFKYLPMYGVVIAFQDFDVFKGVSGSEWVGFANLKKYLPILNFTGCLKIRC